MHDCVPFGPLVKSNCTTIVNECQLAMSMLSYFIKSMFIHIIILLLLIAKCNTFILNFLIPSSDNFLELQHFFSILFYILHNFSVFLTGICNASSVYELGETVCPSVCPVSIIYVEQLHLAQFLKNYS